MANNINANGDFVASYEQQYEVLLEMQSKGFGVCTCGNCAGVILYNQKMKEAEGVVCPHCKVAMAFCDNPDLYYS